MSRTSSVVVGTGKYKKVQTGYRPLTHRVPPRRGSDDSGGAVAPSDKLRMRVVCG
jgi:hypothetical protein